MLINLKNYLLENVKQGREREREKGEAGSRGKSMSAISNCNYVIQLFFFFEARLAPEYFRPATLSASRTPIVKFP